MDRRNVFMNENLVCGRKKERNRNPHHSLVNEATKTDDSKIKRKNELYDWMDDNNADRNTIASFFFAPISSNCRIGRNPEWQFYVSLLSFSTTNWVKEKKTRVSVSIEIRAFVSYNFEHTNHFENSGECDRSSTCPNPMGNSKKVRNVRCEVQSFRLVYVFMCDGADNLEQSETQIDYDFDLPSSCSLIRNYTFRSIWIN